MSILIRDLRLPENCHECFCCDQTYWDEDGDDELIYTCNILKRNTTCFSSERRKDCPLVEVPSDHGRLIDLDQLLWYVDIKDSESECGTFPRYEIKDVLEDAPVIIDKE